MFSMYEAHQLSQELADTAKKDSRLARLTEIEDEVYDVSAQVVLASLAFTEISPTQQEPPPEWIKIYGEAGAMQRLAIARAGWLRSSEAPAGVRLAVQAMAGISRGRAFRTRATQNVLNVQIQLPAPTSSEHPGPEVYEVREIE